MKLIEKFTAYTSTGNIKGKVSLYEHVDGTFSVRLYDLCDVLSSEFFHSKLLTENKALRVFNQSREKLLFA